MTPHARFLLVELISTALVTSLITAMVALAWPWNMDWPIWFGTEHWAWLYWLMQASALFIYSAVRDYLLYGVRKP